MRLLHWTPLLLLVNVCAGQAKEIHFKSVGWTLVVPEGSTTLNSRQVDSLQDATNKKLFKSGVGGINYGDINTLFLFRNGDFNMLGGQINMYDSTGFLNWSQSYQATKKLLLEAIQAQGSRIVLLDTVSSVEKIDNRKFERFYIKTYYPEVKLTLYNCWYCRRQGMYDFSINVTYADEAIGKQYLDLLKASKFD